MTNARPCERCGHRADYHHQPGTHPCGLCECVALVIAELRREKHVGAAVARDKCSLMLYEAGLKALLCFGCGEAIEPGELFVRRCYVVRHTGRYHEFSSKAVPFCRPCMPWREAGIES